MRENFKMEKFMKDHGIYNKFLQMKDSYDVDEEMQQYKRTEHINQNLENNLNIQQQREINQFKNFQHFVNDENCSQ